MPMPDMFTAQGLHTPRNGNGQPQGVMMPKMAVSNGYNVIPDNAQQNHNANQGRPQQVPNFSNDPANSQPIMAPITTSLGATMDQNLKTQQGSTLGGIPIPDLPPHSTTAMQVQVAAAAAAAAAAPLRNTYGGNNELSDGSNSASRARRSNLSASDKAKQNRDRNREHARSTRLRKKAYVQKLKELVDGLHAERTEEVRKRRVAVQHLAEVQSVRRTVVRTFLRFHSKCESDPRKWMTLFEDNFWLKQPVTPYRSFRRTEIEQECRLSRGVEAVIEDTASLAVMVEGIGSRSVRWMQIKREDALLREEARNVSTHMPHNMVRQNSRVQHAVSSLSASSSGSSNGNGSGGEEDKQNNKRKELVRTGSMVSSDEKIKQDAAASEATQKVSASGSSSSSGDDALTQKPSNDFHDYHAPALLDPMLDSGGSNPGSDSPVESQNCLNIAAGTKAVSSDSSSGDEVHRASTKRRKIEVVDENALRVSADQNSGNPVASNTNGNAAVINLRSSLPANIAKSGGISHNVRPANTGVPAANTHIGNPRLNSAPAVPLPPFVGIGKRSPLHQTVSTVGSSLTSEAPASLPITTATTVTTVTGDSTTLSRDSGSNHSAIVAPANIAPDTETSSSNSSNQQSPQIRAIYHMNEDDMILTEDVLMCPFIFRSQDAVLCGALAECIMPGMLRAHFSPRNKLLSLEMVYDAMGFMQQLERASGSEGTAQIVASSLEMALSPNTNEARVITMAKAPYLIVSVNEAWTRTTKYTQMEVEGKAMTILHGERTDPEAGVRPGKPVHKFDDIARGKCASSVNIHYDKEGKDFVDFVSSYPLTNANDEITHILHVCKELPAPSNPTHQFVDSTSNESGESLQNQ